VVTSLSTRHQTLHEGLRIDAAKAAAPYLHSKKPDLLVVARRLSELSVAELTELNLTLSLGPPEPEDEEDK
jgi:hypothetical protein